MRMSRRLRTTAKWVLIVMGTVTAAAGIDLLLGPKKAKAQQYIMIPADVLSSHLRGNPTSPWSALDSLSVPRPPIMSDMSGLFGSPKGAIPLRDWYTMFPPQPLTYPDLSFYGYTTGRIIPRDFLDSNGQTKY